jgi:hypothetical protein
MRFRCGANLRVGEPIVVSLTWPNSLDGSCPLRLRTFGHILRSDEFGTAITFYSYEFHTAGDARGAKTVRALTFRQRVS